MFSTLLAGLPAFFAYLVSGGALLAVFAAIYLRVTPHPELALIRQGNTAAATGFVGALIGYTLPLASAISHSINFFDMLLWAGVGLVVQLLVVAMARKALPTLFSEIERNNLAPALLLAGVSVTAGLVNAASMTY